MDAWNSQWDQTAGTWILGTNSTPGVPWVTHSGTNMTYCGATNDGSIYTDDTDMTGASAIGVTFWYMDDDLDGGTDFEFYVYDGASYDLVVQLNPGSEDVWNKYTWVSTDSQYFDATFRLRFAATPESGEAAFIDDVTINKTLPNSNFRLDIEEQFINLDNNTAYMYKELCVFTGNSTFAEDLTLQGWNITSSAWVYLMNLTANTWNNVTIGTFPNTTSTFTIRFIDGLQASDTTINAWLVDACLVHFWNVTMEGELYEVALSSSISISLIFSRATSFHVGLSTAPDLALTKTTQTDFHVSSTLSPNILLSAVVGILYQISLSLSALVSLVTAIQSVFQINLIGNILSTLSVNLQNVFNVFLVPPIQVGLVSAIASVFNVSLSFSPSTLLTLIADLIHAGQTFNVNLTLSVLVGLAKMIQSIFHIALNSNLTSMMALAIQSIFHVNLTGNLNPLLGLTVNTIFNVALANPLNIGLILSVLTGIEYALDLTMNVIVGLVGSYFHIPFAWIEPTIEEWFVLGGIIGSILVFCMAVPFVMLRRRKKEE